MYSMLQQSLLIQIANEQLRQYQSTENKQDNNQDCSYNILQLVGTDMPPIRNRIAGNYTASNGSEAGQSCFPQNLGNSQTPGYQKSPGNRGYNLRRTYFHHNGAKKELRFGRMRPQSVDSDSGIDSSCSTPSHINCLNDQACSDELSDESFNNDFKGVKRLHDTNGYHQNLSLFHNVPNYHHYYQQNNNNYGPRRNDSPNAGYKRRFYNGGERPMMQGFGAPIRGRKITGVIYNHNHHENIGYLHHPDRFISKYYLSELKHCPDNLKTGSEWDELSLSIWAKFVAHQQPADIFKKKMILWKNLLMRIKTAEPHYNLYVVGSTMSGFGTTTSDVDMCLLTRSCDNDQRVQALNHLTHVQKYLIHLDSVDCIHLIEAKVPILKFRDIYQGIDVDLNFNNSVGIRNTHLLYCYSKLDWRVRPLVLTVKLWAHANDINDAKNMTISSYSLALMVIHFLQCGVKPAVLPCLHKMYKNKFTPDSDIQQIDIHEELPPLSVENKQSLGELFYNFFNYYNTFNFSKDAISIRLGSKIQIDECRRAQTMKNEPHQWKYLCIEEPFDQTNTARSVYNPDSFERIRTVFRVSFQRLKETHCLDSIFSTQAPIKKTI
uniref:Uncharacterized protein n=1 Tax=Clastoptera arizonana TaxID=38151 RepID=A0A1B6CDZ4_9HEMI